MLVDRSKIKIWSKTNEKIRFQIGIPITGYHGGFLFFRVCWAILQNSLGFLGPVVHYEAGNRVFIHIKSVCIQEFEPNTLYFAWHVRNIIGIRQKSKKSGFQTAVSRYGDHGGFWFFRVCWAILQNSLEFLRPRWCTMRPETKFSYT